MKKLSILMITSIIVLSGCSTKQEPQKEVLGANQLLTFTHIDGFGTKTDSPAFIAWEFEAQSYVKYQLAYTSCTCRQESDNCRSFIYFEINKDGSIKDVQMHYWGDSDPIPDGPTKAELEKDFIPLFIGKNQTEIADIDTIAGATVTTINLKQLSDALITYHLNKYAK